VRPPFKGGPDAESLAIDALAFLASDVERLGRFLSLTGLSPETIRQAARSRHFMAAVLDHLAGDESLLLAFAANHGIDPARVLQARESLARPNAMGQRDG
jgi:hypothetical protein